MSGKTVRLSGWVHRKRDHGNLLFVDLRDHYGLTQCVLDTSSPLFKAARAGPGGERGHRHRQGGRPRRRRPPTPSCRPARSRSRSSEFTVQSAADMLPLPGQQRRATTREEIRLKYRFLDLRREKAARQHRAALAGDRQPAPPDDRPGLHRVPDADPDRRPARKARATSWCPARMHPGKFYALPQAPQQFKQLLMVAGLRPLLPDRAVLPRRGRAAPTARRASSTSSISRCASSPRTTCSPRSSRCCTACSRNSPATARSRRRRSRASPIDEAMLKYGIDKPDLRNPIVHQRRHRDLPRLEFRRLRQGGRDGRRGARDPGAGRRPEAAQLLRQAERLGARAGRGRARLYRSSRPAAARARSPRILDDGADRAAAGRCRRRGRRCRVLRPADKALRRGEVRRHRAQQARRGTGPDRAERASNSAGSSISRCSSSTRTPVRSSSATTRSRCRRAAWRRWRSRTR